MPEQRNESSAAYTCTSCGFATALCVCSDGPRDPETSHTTSAAYTPCTCTVACIPQGITDEQTCRLQLENESIRVRDLRHLPSCAIYNGSPACSCLAVAEAVKRGAA